MSKTIHAVNASYITDVSIVLCFKEIKLGTGILYLDTFPTVWKVFNLARGSMPAQRTVNFNYSAVICEKDNNNFVVAGAQTPVATSQEVKAWRDGNNFVHIDTAVAKEGGAITITNKGTERVNLALFDDQGASMMIQHDVVGNSSAVFIPKQIIWAYVINNYKENEILRSEIVTTASARFDLTTIKTDVTITYTDEDRNARLEIIEGVPLN